MSKHLVSTMPIRLLSYAAVISACLIGGTLQGRAQSAYDYPFCGVFQDRSGATSCYFSSYAQCMATMRAGNSGFCRSNPFYRGPTVIDPPRRRARRR